MGRLLDIAKAVPAAGITEEQKQAKGSSDLREKVYRPEMPACAQTPTLKQCSPAADVLDIVAQATSPMPHPRIVAEMLRRGHSKTTAVNAVADCQAERKIEHNLVTGYVVVPVI